MKTGKTLVFDDDPGAAPVAAMEPGHEDREDDG